MAAYALTGTVVASTPIPGTTLAAVIVNFSGVQVTLNVDATDAETNWQPDATPTITFSSP